MGFARLGFLQIFALLFLFGIFGALILALLIFLGAASIDVCESETSASVAVNSPVEAASFQTKWDGFNSTLDSGQTVSVTFTESEATSRANEYIEEQGDEIRDILVCLNDGFGEASAKIEVPFLSFLPKIDVRVTGTVDLSGASPEAKIDDIQVGGAPDALSDRMEGFVEGLIDDQLDDLEIDHTYDLSIDEGSATVSGSP